DRSNRQRRANGGLRAAADDVVGGTLPYMAPELLQEAAFVGPWTDIYAFGVMLYEFFTGKLPFDSMRDESLVRMHLRVAPPDPRTLKPDLHPGVTHIINRCLAKRQTDRYQSFAEAEDDLQMLRKHLLGALYTATWPEQDNAERERQTELGLAHLDAGEYSEALGCFRQEVALDTSRAEGWLNVARARLKLWQYQEGLQAAEEGLRRAIRREEFGQLYGIRGQIYTAMLLLPKAMESFDQGLSYTPKAHVSVRPGAFVHPQGPASVARERAADPAHGLAARGPAMLRKGAGVRQA